MVSSPFQRGVSKDIASGVMATLIIFGASVFMPIVGFIFALFMPLPVLYYRTKLGRQHGLIVPLVTVAVMGVVMGGITLDTLFFTMLMLLGFSMSEMFEKKLSVEITVVGTCAMVLGSCLGGLLIYSIANQTNILALVSAYVATNLEMSLELYKGIGIPQETIDAIAGSLDRIHYVLIRILPSLAIISTLIVTWANLIAVRPLFDRKGLAMPEFGPLNRWQAPDYLIWGLIGSGVALLVPATGLRMLGLNGLLVMLAVYFFQGIAVISFFFEKKKLPRAIRVAIYLMIAFQQLFLLAVICIGVFDMWGNFRKITIDKRNSDPSL